MISEAKASAGGCAKKVPSARLRELLEGAALNPGVVNGVRHRYDLDDVVQLSLSPAVDRLVATTDLLFALPGDPARFGRVAAVHALSDVFAALSEPLFATLALGVTHGDLKNGRAEGIIRGVEAALAENGAALAGGHTVLAQEAFVALSAVGRPRILAPLAPVEVGDAVILSKPLGSGLALTALRLSAITEAEVAPAFTGMTLSNRCAADVLVAAEQLQAGCVHGVTDVSGFGFLEALSRLLGHATARVCAKTVPTWPCVPRLIADQAWSGLMDENILESDRFTTYEFGVRSQMVWPLNDPQTSGGLLAVVTPELSASKSLLDDGGFRLVGYVESLGGECRIEVVN